MVQKYVNSISKRLIILTITGIPVRLSLLFGTVQYPSNHPPIELVGIPPTRMKSELSKP